jgi:hypothetical protein
MGQTAKAFPRCARISSRIWGTARIGPILISGLLGQMLIGLNMRYKVHGAGIRFTGLPVK